MLIVKFTTNSQATSCCNKLLIRQLAVVTFFTICLLLLIVCTNVDTSSQSSINKVGHIQEKIQSTTLKPDEDEEDIEEKDDEKSTTTTTTTTTARPHRNRISKNIRKPKHQKHDNEKNNKESSATKMPTTTTSTTLKPEQNKEEENSGDLEEEEKEEEEEKKKKKKKGDKDDDSQSRADLPNESSMNEENKKENINEKDKHGNEEESEDGQSRAGLPNAKVAPPPKAAAPPPKAANSPAPNATAQAWRPWRNNRGGGGGGGGRNYVLDEGSAQTPGGGFAGCGKAPLNKYTSASGYIIHGEHIQYGEFPQYIRLITSKPNNMLGLCGGTLVSDRYVITAAHCVKEGDQLLPASWFTVVFGEDSTLRRDRNEVRVGISDICVSPKYTHKSIRYDWAVLTLKKPIKFNNFIQPACLPKGDQLIHTRGPNSMCYLVGAGAIAMTPDRNSPSTAIDTPSDVVNKLHAENVPCLIWDFGAIDQDRVCYTKANGGDGDSCVGDSGGPILCLDQQKRWTLMASVSYGSTFCEHSKVAVYARTRTLLPEMEQHCGIKLA